ncbi:integrase family protein [Abyssibius alkaniclasticus]|uniref:tyrosine-type recombinase/integrase n=1 Tax=Abyssibius alkaniclasticus TaxID=2881234 RepID=UPI00236409D9|nr:integrase family protein [Abyssibius alkaniclasticus]UPH72718.1 integrase family protein [Abyssibius alkaniclasticus]
MFKLTKRNVEALESRANEYFVWDSEVAGFGVRVFPSGRKTYLVQYRVGRRTKRITIAQHGVLTSDEARKQARKLLGEIAQGGDPSGDKKERSTAPTVASLIDRFLNDYAAHHVKPSTARDYASIAARLIKPQIGLFHIADVTRADIVALHHSLRDTPYQANRMLSLASRMFNLAEDWGLRAEGSNPVRRIKKFREEEKKRYLSEAEQARLGEVLGQALEDGTETVHAVSAILLLLFTGCRLGEIRTLRWDWVTARHLELPDSKTGRRRIGIQHGPDDISISRADFCVDLLAPGFVLIPDQFVMHSAAGRRDHVTDTEKSVNGKSGRTTSVTIGSSRNRQAIVYDKRAEVIAHSKSYWWGIWNHTLAQIGPDRTLLSPDPAQADANRVIRVEFRAGKDLLKDTWGIRTWAQFFDRFGDLCRQSGQVIRYTQPVPGDSNRARWPDHPLWDAACEAMNDDLAEMRSGADPNPLKAVQREDHINMLFRNVLGTSITLGALMGVGFDDLPATLADLAKRMRAELAKNPDKTAKQLQAAKERYVFIGETDATLQAR